MSKTKAFDEHLNGYVNEDRMKDYGHPADHFRISAAIKEQLMANFKGDPKLRHPLEMIADKMARLCHSPEHLDSWIDIAGYARTACMVMDKDDQRKQWEKTTLVSSPADPDEWSTKAFARFDGGKE